MQGAQMCTMRADSPKIELESMLVIMDFIYLFIHL